MSRSFLRSRGEVRGARERTPTPSLRALARQSLLEVSDPDVQGAKKPNGPSLKLLNLVAEKGMFDPILLIC